MTKSVESKSFEEAKGYARAFVQALNNLATVCDEHSHDPFCMHPRKLKENIKPKR